MDLDEGENVNHSIDTKDETPPSDNPNEEGEDEVPDDKETNIDLDENKDGLSDELEKRSPVSDFPRSKQNVESGNLDVVDGIVSSASKTRVLSLLPSIEESNEDDGDASSLLQPSLTSASSSSSSITSSVGPHLLGPGVQGVSSKPNLASITEESVSRANNEDDAEEEHQSLVQQEDANRIQFACNNGMFSEFPDNSSIDVKQNNLCNDIEEDSTYKQEVALSVTDDAKKGYGDVRIDDKVLEIDTEQSNKQAVYSGGEGSLGKDKADFLDNILPISSGVVNVVIREQTDTPIDGSAMREEEIESGVSKEDDAKEPQCEAGDAMAKTEDKTFPNEDLNNDVVEVDDGERESTMAVGLTAEIAGPDSDFTPERDESQEFGQTNTDGVTEFPTKGQNIDKEDNIEDKNIDKVPIDSETVSNESSEQPFRSDLVHCDAMKPAQEDDTDASAETDMTKDEEAVVNAKEIFVNEENDPAVIQSASEDERKSTSFGKAKGSGSDSKLTDPTSSSCDVSAARESHSEHTLSLANSEKQDKENSDKESQKKRDKDKDRDGNKRKKERGVEEGSAVVEVKQCLKNAVGDARSEIIEEDHSSESGPYICEIRGSDVKTPCRLQFQIVDTANETTHHTGENQTERFTLPRSETSHQDQDSQQDTDSISDSVKQNNRLGKRKGKRRKKSSESFVAVDRKKRQVPLPNEAETDSLDTFDSSNCIDSPLSVSHTDLPISSEASEQSSEIRCPVTSTNLPPSTIQDELVNQSSDPDKADPSDEQTTGNEESEDVRCRESGESGKMGKDNKPPLIESQSEHEMQIPLAVDTPLSTSEVAPLNESLQGHEPEQCMAADDSAISSESHSISSAIYKKEDNEIGLVHCFEESKPCTGTDYTTEIEPEVLSEKEMGVDNEQAETSLQNNSGSIELIENDSITNAKEDEHSLSQMSQDGGGMDAIEGDQQIQQVINVPGSPVTEHVTPVTLVKEDLENESGRHEILSCDKVENGDTDSCTMNAIEAQALVPDIHTTFDLPILPVHSQSLQNDENLTYPAEQKTDLIEKESSKAITVLEPRQDSTDTPLQQQECEEGNEDEMIEKTVGSEYDQPDHNADKKDTEETVNQNIQENVDLTNVEENGTSERLEQQQPNGAAMELELEPKEALGQTYPDVQAVEEDNMTINEKEMNEGGEEDVEEDGEENEEVDEETEQELTTERGTAESFEHERLTYTISVDAISIVSDNQEKVLLEQESEMTEEGKEEEKGGEDKEEKEEKEEEEEEEEEEEQQQQQQQQQEKEQEQEQHHRQEEEGAEVAVEEEEEEQQHQQQQQQEQHEENELGMDQKQKEENPLLAQEDQENFERGKIEWVGNEQIEDDYQQDQHQQKILTPSESEEEIKEKEENEKEEEEEKEEEREEEEEEKEQEEQEQEQEQEQGSKSSLLEEHEGNVKIATKDTPEVIVKYENPFGITKEMSLGAEKNGDLHLKTNSTAENIHCGSQSQPRDYTEELNCYRPRVFNQESCPVYSDPNSDSHSGLDKEQACYTIDNSPKCDDSSDVSETKKQGNLPGNSDSLDNGIGTLDDNAIENRDTEDANIDKADLIAADQAMKTPGLLGAEGDDNEKYECVPFHDDVDRDKEQANVMLSQSGCGECIADPFTLTSRPKTVIPSDTESVKADDLVEHEDIVNLVETPFDSTANISEAVHLIPIIIIKNNHDLEKPCINTDIGTELNYFPSSLVSTNKVDTPAKPMTEENEKESDVYSESDKMVPTKASSSADKEYYNGFDIHNHLKRTKESTDVFGDAAFADMYRKIECDDDSNIVEEENREPCNVETKLDCKVRESEYIESASERESDEKEEATDKSDLETIECSWQFSDAEKETMHAAVDDEMDPTARPVQNRRLINDEAAAYKIVDDEIVPQMTTDLDMSTDSESKTVVRSDEQQQPETPVVESDQHLEVNSETVTIDAGKEHVPPSSAEHEEQSEAANDATYDITTEDKDETLNDERILDVPDERTGLSGVGGAKSLEITENDLSTKKVDEEPKSSSTLEHEGSLDGDSGPLPEPIDTVAKPLIVDVDVRMAEDHDSGNDDEDNELETDPEALHNKVRTAVSLDAPSSSEQVVRKKQSLWKKVIHRLKHPRSYNKKLSINPSKSKKRSRVRGLSAKRSADVADERLATDEGAVGNDPNDEGWKTLERDDSPLTDYKKCNSKHMVSSQRDQCRKLRRLQRLRNGAETVPDKLPPIRRQIGSRNLHRAYTGAHASSQTSSKDVTAGQRKTKGKTRKRRSDLLLHGHVKDMEMTHPGEATPNSTEVFEVFCDKDKKEVSDLAGSLANKETPTVRLLMRPLMSGMNAQTSQKALEDHTDTIENAPTNQLIGETAPMKTRPSKRMSCVMM